MSTAKYTPRLAKKYKDEVVPALVKKFSYSSVMQTPKLKKIAINRGVNGAVADKKLVEVAVEELSQITGQKAVATSNCVKACRLVLELLYVVKRCMSFLTG